jgi:surface polysaccharide O-acyltransferase-like enzyme
MNPTQPPAFFWADRLRIIATVMVIVIHVAAPVCEDFKDLHSSEWWAGNLWNSLSRPSVPLFVMLSGFLLLGKNYELGDFLRRRFMRVAVPALVWMIAYSYYNHVAHAEPATFWEGARMIVEGPVHYHLWFVYLILGLYLAYPVLRPFVRQATERDFLFFFAVCVAGTWMYKILATFFDLYVGLYWEFFTNHLGHFVAGYYLANKVPAGGTPPVEGIRPWRFNRKQLIRLALALILTGFITTALATYWASLANGNKFFSHFYDYLTINVGISTIGWFILAQQTLNGRPLLEVEGKFAGASFGIYLAHVLVMDWWAEAGYWHSKFHPAKCIPIVAGLTVLMTFLLVLILRTLPGGKKIT